MRIKFYFWLLLRILYIASFRSSATVCGYRQICDAEAVKGIGTLWIKMTSVTFKYLRDRGVFPVMPAQAGIQGLSPRNLAQTQKHLWIPAFAGMTSFE